MPTLEDQQQAPTEPPPEQPLGTEPERRVPPELIEYQRRHRRRVKVIRVLTVTLTILAVGLAVATFIAKGSEVSAQNVAVAIAPNGTVVIGLNRANGLTMGLTHQLGV